MVARFTPHRLSRCDSGGFARRNQRGDDRNRGASANRRYRRYPRNCHRCRRAGDENRVHSIGNHTDHGARQHASQRDSDEGSDHAEHCGFAQENREDAARAYAERAQNAYLRSSPHHAHRDRVVNEECAHQQRNITQYLQIPAERPQHALVLFAASARRCYVIGERHRLANHFLHARRIFSWVNRHFDAVDPAIGIEQLLGDRDVHRDPAHALADHYFLHLKTRRTVPPAQFDIVPGPPAESLCRVAGYNGHLRIDERFHAEQRDRALPINRNRLLNHRCKLRIHRQRRQLCHDALIDATIRGDLVVHGANQRSHRGLERPGCGVARQIDRDHDGNAERDGKNRQSAA